MKVEFLQPLWLLLFPLLLGIICYIAWKGVFPSKFQRGLHTALRTVVCLLLVLAMATPLVSLQTKGTTTVFAVDRSASVAGQDVSAFLEEAYENRDKEDGVGLIYFGKGGSVEFLPTTDEGPSILSSSAYVDNSGTDIAGALQLATGIMPEGRAKRIVLLSDGQETTADALMTARGLAGMGIVVDVVEMQGETSEEIQLTELSVPSIVSKNMEYEVVVQVDSTITTQGEVRLYKNNVLIGQESLTFPAGESRVVFNDITKEGGSATYQAELFAEEDSNTKNNRVYGHTFIDDVPRVLIVEQDGSGTAWEELLSAVSVQTKRVDASAVPVALEELQAYDSVILANVSADGMPMGFLDVLETYTRTLGGGLIVSGGKNAFALGSYGQTVLEDMLPVSMELKTEGEEHDLALVMVIDRSGSMSSGTYNVSLMEIAKEAAIRGLDSLKDGDKVGVIAFDTEYKWAVPITPITGNKETIINGIEGIQLGGGTSILPALQEAIKKLLETDAKEKHIILLTDGQAEQTGYDLWLNRMSEGGITLSTVAIGSSADSKLMQYLADGGGGRYYFTNEFTDLPEIFLKETLLAGKDYLNNRNFYPKQQDASAILSGIDATPSLDGYVGSTAKGRAQVALVSDKDEPVLASWQYGLGRVAVWTSDVGEGWTQKWLAQDQGVAVLQNTVAWALNKQVAQDIKLTAESGAQESTLRLEMPYDEALRKVEAVVAASGGEVFESELTMVAPGIYEGKLDTVAEGAYVANLALVMENGETQHYNKGFSIRYPLEYDLTFWKDGGSLLSQIAQSTGGRVLQNGGDVFSQKLEAVTWNRDVSMGLLIVALLLFLLDIAFRRFSVLPIALEQRWNAIGNRRREAKKQKKTPKVIKAVDKEKARTATGAEPPSMGSQEDSREQSGEGAGKQVLKPKPQSTAEKLAEARKKRSKY